MIVVTALGLKPLGILPLTSLLFEGNWAAFWSQAGLIPGRPDFWLWFYLAFVVSSTMLPSASDRRAWWSMGLVLLLVIFLALIPGVSDWMVANLAGRINSGLRAVSMVFAASSLIHIVLAIPAFFIKLMLARITGLRVV
jgi:hypothetical protein